MNSYNCKKYLKQKYDDKIDKEINLTTVINFEDCKRSSINVKASNINNKKFNITKLEFK